ncbi:peroxisomal membrane protein PEX16 [Leptidea sinapis]|uniref:Peroxisomal membrane protein PEX16 n=1 Tax=Leptidea sinapis TaxID=189913 RepID=A0A5E4PMS0_9NEOP|nr:peroxisomal membrane protein PEX16 [Leptidea sinapis]VVC86364.1 unnamed protein product [Leptidea sinapis]
MSLKELYEAYRKWVINNPNLVTDVETVATWSSYFIVGKINNSAVVSELVYAISKLLSLFNDRIIKEAYGDKMLFYGLQEQIKLWLTIIHYCEVFVELAVRNKWKTRGKWTVATILQIFKCSMSMVLLYRFKEMPIHYPPIPSLQRKKITEGNVSDESNSFFTLRRSGRVVRGVEGAPSVSLRDWQPIKICDNNSSSILQSKDLENAELLHIIRPLVHLTAMRVFGTKSWKQWVVALGLDVASYKLYNKHMKDLTQEQRLEVSRRKLGLVLYLLRSPLYNRYSKNVIERMLKFTSNKMPITSYVSEPILKYLNYWQEIYFYMWAM